MEAQIVGLAVYFYICLFVVGGDSTSQISYYRHVTLKHSTVADTN